MHLSPLTCLCYNARGDDIAFKYARDKTQTLNVCLLYLTCLCYNTRGDDIAFKYARDKTRKLSTYASYI